MGEISVSGDARHLLRWQHGRVDDYEIALWHLRKRSLASFKQDLALCVFLACGDCMSGTKRVHKTF